jgi:glycosyltransferase involved in cell wall biosynthesis
VWFFLKCLVRLSIQSVVRPYDVVHVHNIPDFLVFCAVMAKLRGSRIILDIHDVVPELYAGKFKAAHDSHTCHLLRVVERASCRFADHVIIANHLWYDKVTRRSVAAEKCTVMLNYPDLSVFQRGQVGCGAPHPGFVFLYPGTLNHHQGLDLAVEAFASVAGQMPTAELHIYGDGPAKDGLVEQVSRLGLRGRVRIMDLVPLHSVPALMMNADVGVVPKRADGFGDEAFSTKILEFMACGVPVVVARTRVDAFYFPEDTVRFFAPGNAQDLAAQMMWMYENRDEVTRIAGRATAHVSRFAWDKHRGVYFGRIDELTGAGTARSSLRVEEMWLGQGPQEQVRPEPSDR